MGSRSPWEGAILWGKGASHCKVWGHSAVTCAKTGEPIQVPFGLWPWNGPRKHELDKGPDPPPQKKGQFSGERVARCKV